MQLKRYLVLLIVLTSTACASSSGTWGETPVVTITPDGAYTVICVDSICRSHKRVHTHSKSCGHDD